MMKHWVPILFVSILASCTPRTESVPKNLLSEAEMVDALAGVHILESAAKLNLLEGIKSDSLSLKQKVTACWLSIRVLLFMQKILKSWNGLWTRF